MSPGQEEAGAPSTPRGADPPFLLCLLQISRKVRSLPIAFGLAVPTRLARIHLSLSLGQAFGGLAGLLRWLRTPLLLEWQVPNHRLNRPGQGFKVPIHGVVIRGLATLPLAAVIAWTSGGATLSIGLGDLLLASVFPLVLRKAYGRMAGLVAFALAMCVIGVLLAFPSRTGFPVMLVLGPLTAAQYILSRWRRGPERTTKRYLLEETIHSSDKRCMRMRLTLSSPCSVETASHFRQQNGRFRLVLLVRRRHTWDDQSDDTDRMAAR
jgi:hypothetical protein